MLDKAFTLLPLFDGDNLVSSQQRDEGLRGERGSIEVVPYLICLNSNLEMESEDGPIHPKFGHIVGKCIGGNRNSGGHSGDKRLAQRKTQGSITYKIKDGDGMMAIERQQARYVHVRMSR
jgi:hypothetical protein